MLPRWLCGGRVFVSSIPRAFLFGSQHKPLLIPVGPSGFSSASVEVRPCLIDSSESPFVLARQENGPLADERRRYLAHCVEQRLSWRTLQAIALYTLVVAEALRMAERPGECITRAEIEAEADRWFNRRSAKAMVPKSRQLLRLYFTNHVARWLIFLGRLQVAVTVQHPYADHVTKFADSVRERGLSPQTVAYYSRAINHFLAQIEEAGRHLKSLTIVQVDELLAKKVAEEGYARSTIQRWSSVLCLFLRFAEERGWCRKGLAAAITAPRVFAHESLPVGPSWDDVKRLLAAANGDRPVDIRGRALLMLLAVYGLRAGEIAALRLQDFDWER